MALLGNVLQVTLTEASMIRLARQATKETHHEWTHYFSEPFSLTGRPTPAKRRIAG